MPIIHSAPPWILVCLTITQNVCVLRVLCDPFELRCQELRDTCTLHQISLLCYTSISLYKIIIHVIIVISGDVCSQVNVFRFKIVVSDQRKEKQVISRVEIGKAHIIHIRSTSHNASFAQVHYESVIAYALFRKSPQEGEDRVTAKPPC
ncbi:predicted protein [Lichtheimia corymbifera JMRC:FSU:9682]|uniref:Uncharacterized protein n=1 Tax=Lichtheimia corymbifera JMRC:FSU:9682 TaxID=1263082 RepID=A0A068SD63_9FUNG|nr:predicted protein [Lichtheimia corymbifera JMRC:FSU:9682]